MHPNRAEFSGILTIVDEVSDKSPAGARGHRVILTRKAAEDALLSLVGMGINCKSGHGGHDAHRKFGVISEAHLQGNEIRVRGHLWERDEPGAVKSIEASEEEFGMSYEVVDASVPDMRAEIWLLERVTFTGAAVVLKAKAAYSKTSFKIHRKKESAETEEAE